MKQLSLLFLLIVFRTFLFAQSGNVLHFDGSDDYVQFDTLCPTTFTFMAWVKPDRVSGYDQAIVSTLSEGTLTGFELHIDVNARPIITMRDNGNWTGCGLNTIPAGQWVHLAATFDGDSCRLYVNGTLEDSSDITSYSPGVQPMYFGKRPSSDQYPFKGCIDEAGLWDTALSQSQIASYMTSFPTGSEAGLLDCYNFDQGKFARENPSDTILFDNSGNGYNGVLHNFALSGFSSNWLCYLQPEIDVQGDFSFLGYVPINSGSVTRTYTIVNSGDTTLYLTGTSPYISISSDSTEFVVSAAPPDSVAAGDSSTFDITFTPVVLGTRSATLTIANVDTDESSYSFSIQGEGMADSSPRMEVCGNRVAIANGDTIPSSADYTQFAGGLAPTTATRNFVIYNTGVDTLRLSGAAPYISFTGADADKFSVSTIPSAAIASGESTTFGITFSSDQSRWHTATASIANNDTDNTPFTFALQVYSFAGGGTESNPYQVATLDDLEWLSESSYTWGCYFIQTADIDASETAGWNDGQGFSPIGNGSVNFTGNYNGQGYSIDKLTMNRSHDYVGFLGYSNGATISNVGLTNVEITGSANNLGGLVALSLSSTLQNCSCTGNIYSSSTASHTGGLCGYSRSTLVKNCFSSCCISGRSKTGGLIGSVEYDNSTIENCFSTGNVSGSIVGGLIGMLASFDTGSEGNSIINCYSASNVVASVYAGGLIGFAQLGTISNCYSLGRVSGSTLGGFIGHYNTTTNSCYWNINTSGTSAGTYTGVTNLTTPQMMQDSNFTDWDFTSVWNIDNSNTFPYLQGIDNLPIALPDTLSALPASFTSMSSALCASLTANDFAPDDPGAELVAKWIGNSIQANDTISIQYQAGSIVDGDTLWGAISYAVFPYTPVEIEISSYDDLKKIGITGYPLYNMSATYRLTADIDASASADENGGLGFAPIGTKINPFIGTIHGNGHKISGLTINRPSEEYIGFLGYTKKANIDSLGLINLDVTGYDYVGSMAGYIDTSTTIVYCHTGGSVTGANVYVGGMVAYANYSSIENSYSTCDVLSTTTVRNYCIGGFAGRVMYSTIQNCYSSGDVTSDRSYSGGFGSIFSNSTVTDCYTTSRSNGRYVMCGFVCRPNTCTFKNCYSAGEINATSFYGFSSTNTGNTLSNNYWDLETSGTSAGVGSSNVTGVTGLTTAQMKKGSSFSGWSLDSWAFINNRTYPALLAVENNAPFAFADDLVIDSSVVLTQLLANDYDYENYQNGLTYKIISCTGNYGEIKNGTFTFNYPGFLSKDTIVYRVGEIVSEGDTLWGNFATAVIQTPSQGNGTESDPYQITTLNDLKELSETPAIWGMHFVQTANIDASATNSWNEGAGFSPIGNGYAKFTGTYKGQGHIIDGLFIDRPTTDSSGFFGFTFGAEIDSLGLTNVSVTGHNCTGGFIGCNNSSQVFSCFCTGSVIGASTVGGFTGQNLNSSGISESYSLCAVSGTGTIGGFAGNNSSEISRCYAAGTVVGTVTTGGFAGYNSSILTGCYWDTEASGLSSGTGSDVNGQLVLGLTTSEMKIQGNYSGWDFMSEWSNGSNNYWAVSSNINNGYPCLSWQGTLALPVVSTEAVSDINVYTATGKGNISDLGFPNPTGHGICWNTYGEPTLNDSWIDSAYVAATGNYEIAVTGLDAGTIYYLRAFVIHDAGIVYGDVVTFKTAGEGVPIDLDVSDSTMTTGEACFNALNELTVAGSSMVTVENSASASFIAYTSIRFLPGFHAEAGSYVHGWITTDGSFCDAIESVADAIFQQYEKNTTIETGASILPARKEMSMKVYPNPNNGSFTIAFSNEITAGAILSVYNQLGKLVYQTILNNGHSEEISLDNVPWGIYLVNVISGNEKYCKKIMVND